MSENRTTDDFDDGDDDVPMAQAGDLTGLFQEFMEMDGAQTGAESNAMRLAFVAGASAMLMLLGGRMHEAARDAGGSVKEATWQMLVRDGFQECNTALNGADDE